MSDIESTGHHQTEAERIDTAIERCEREIERLRELAATLKRARDSQKGKPCTIKC